MTSRLYLTAVCVALIAAANDGMCRADEPKKNAEPVISVKAIKIEAKAAVSEKAAAHKAEAGKGAGASEFDAVAAPFVEALAEKMDLNAVDVQVQQWIPQFTQQYRPILQNELNFIRLICDLKPEQRPKIKAAGEASVKEIVRQLAEQQGRAMAGVNFVEQQPTTPPEPRRFILDAINKALKETLTEEQMTKYLDESSKRTALRKRAAIMSAVSLIDSHLCLTVEQRNKIIEAISSKWQAEWESWLMLSQYGGQYFPTIPDNLIVTHLNTEQKSVWDSFQKVNFGFWSNGDEEQLNDGWWGDEPEKKAEPVGGQVGF
jgi:uncharacterized protein YifE (UPF0438 family)